MLDIYKNCPVIENERFLLRLVEEGDAGALMKVYGDKAALPYFNSDNCHDFSFYITSESAMVNMIKYWLREYSEGGFVRFTVVDKRTAEPVGTVELFNRKSTDDYNNCGLLRLDLRADYENSRDIADALSAVVGPAYRLFECRMLATKGPIYAVERIEALRNAGFVPTEESLVGSDGKTYYDYWVRIE